MGGHPFRFLNTTMLSTLAVDVRARTYTVLLRLELRYDISSDLGTVHI
jgi:hypothetical protein